MFMFRFREDSTSIQNKKGQNGLDKNIILNRKAIIEKLWDYVSSAAKKGEEKFYTPLQVVIDVRKR